MPSYISHAIMGEELCNELYKEHLIERVPIKVSEMKACSLGPDLAYLSKKNKKK